MQNLRAIKRLYLEKKAAFTFQGELGENVKTSLTSAGPAIRNRMDREIAVLTNTMIYCKRKRTYSIS